MPFINVNDVRYYFAVQGTGPPLLLLHGFTGSSANWTRHVDVFGEQFLTIVVDLPGHGRTDSPADPARYSMEKCAGDIAALLAEQLPAPVNLLGYSMGGRLALYLALTRPSLVNKLILESTSPGLKTAAERRQRIHHDEQLAEMIEREGVEAFVGRWQQLPLFASQQQLPAPVRAELRQQRRQNSAMGLANSLRGMGAGVQPSLWPRLPQLERPTLLLAGERDHKFANLNREMASLMPVARLEIVPGAGHTIHLEQPEMFNEFVLSFSRQPGVIKETST